MKNKAKTLKQLSNEDYKTQLAQKYKDIPKGAFVTVIDDNYQNLYGSFCVVIYNGISYYVKKRDLDFNIKRKLYILSNSTDGIQNIKGNYLVIDDTGKVLYEQHCSDKKYAKKDLITGNPDRLRECSSNYGNDFKILFLGEDKMTLERLVQLHNENYLE